MLNKCCDEAAYWRESPIVCDFACELSSAQGSRVHARAAIASLHRAAPAATHNAKIRVRPTALLNVADRSVDELDITHVSIWIQPAIMKCVYLNCFVSLGSECLGQSPATGIGAKSCAARKGPRPLLQRWCDA